MPAGSCSSVPTRAPGRPASLSGGRRPRSCGTAGVSTRCARSPRRYGPLGDTPPAPRLGWQLWALRPGLDGASRPSTTLTGRGGPPDSGMARAGPEPVGVGVTGGDGPAGLAPRGAHRVGSTTRARGLGEGAGGPPGAGGDRAARGRPTATPTFGPGARRVPRRAPVRDEPPGGLVRLLNTWPHDRHDSRRRSSLRSAVIARDRGC